jgi:hypothetical protein
MPVRPNGLKRKLRDALKRGARLASVETLETVLYQALKGWLRNVTT